MEIEEIITGEFFASLEGLGITPRNDLNLIMDGQIHRFSTDEDRGGAKSGAYYIHSDGWPNWGVMDFRKYDGMQKFKLSRERMPESAKQNDYKRAAAEREEREKQAAEESRRRAWNEYTRANSEGAKFHPYCRLKKIAGISGKLRVVVAKSAGDFCAVGDLLIPLVNAVTRKFQTLQRISRQLMSNGQHMKGIYKNTRLACSCFEFLPRDISSAKKIIICEGFATGASIFNVARVPSVVLAAMSCNNIINVARAWSKRASLPIIIAADNDNAGITAAKNTINAGLANKIMIPPITGYDWNDYINMKAN